VDCPIVIPVTLWTLLTEAGASLELVFGVSARHNFEILVSGFLKVWQGRRLLLTTGCEP
jgi:hypothetical protein